MSGMLNPKNSLSIYQCETKTLRLIVQKRDPDNSNACIPVDITGSVVYFTVKRKASDTDFLIRKVSTSAAQIELSDPRGGIARIFIQPSDTADLSPKGEYVYDVWIILQSGAQHVIVKPAKFQVLQPVTKLP